MRYQTCSLLEAGLNITPKHARACCCNTKTFELPILQTYDQIEGIDLDAIERTRQGIIDGHKNGVVCRACENCPNLFWVNEQPTEVQKNIFVNTFEECNLKCTYCFLQKKPKNEIVSVKNAEPLLPLIKKMIISGRIDANTLVRFGGGEPTLLPEFGALVEALCGAGASIVVNSNCTIYSEAIYQGLKMGRLLLNCSIDAATSVTYRRVKGHSLLDNVRLNLCTYATANRSKIEAKFIVMESNYFEAAPFALMCSAWGIKHVVYDLDLFSCVVPDHLIEAIADMTRCAKKIGLTCTFGQTALGIWAENDCDRRLELACATRETRWV